MARMMVLGTSFTALAIGLAQPAAAQEQPAATADGLTAADSGNDIVVTARKRAEKLNEVPASVTAFSGARLEGLQARSLEDYAALIPGLQIQQGSRGAGTLALRGINTGREPSQLVGVLVDGVPYGSTGTFAFAGISQLDASTYDLDRIEVLRGPQGTLYGAGAFGGLVAYYYKQPDLTDYAIRAESEVATTDGAHRASYAGRGAINLPFARDMLALRVSASYEDDAGWIDNPLRAKKDINGNTLLNVHGALLFKPSDRFSIRLDGLHQRSDRDAIDTVLYNRSTRQPTLGDRDQARPVSEAQTLTQNQGSGTITGDLGFATLTSVSSYAETRTDATSDLSRSAVAFQLSFVPGIGPFIGTVAVDVDVKVKKFVEEVRLTSDGSGPFNWLVGGFYTDESSLNDQFYRAGLADGTPIAPLTPFLTLKLDSHFEEYAAFGNATYDLTDRLRIEGGVRYSENRQRFQQTTSGAPGPLARSSEDRIDYAATARYRVGADSYAYARFATGYRAGGPNIVLPGAPGNFKSDSIDNYEAGFKARFMDGRASIDTSVFYIDWKDVQLTTSIAGLSFRVNGGKASSKGVETAFSFAVSPSLTFSGSLAYTDSKLEDPAAPVGGRAGERLPNTPRLSGAVVVDYRFPISDRAKAFVGATTRFAGDRTASFDGDAGTPQFVLDGYDLTDFRAGVDFGQFKLTGFVKNAFDQRAQLTAGTGFLILTNEAAVTIARPRTIGATLGVSF